MRASIALEQLGDLLRDKAGITEPGPWVKLCAEKKKRFQAAEPVPMGG